MEKTTVSKSGILKFDVRFFDTGESKKIFLGKYKNQLKEKNFCGVIKRPALPSRQRFCPPSLYILRDVFRCRRKSVTG